MASVAPPRLIVKVGSSLLVDDDGTVRGEWLAALVAEIAARVKDGQQVAVVSSGAIALGARRLGLAKGGRASLEDAQAAAATGQIALAGLWARLLGAHGIRGAQMLLTLDDLEDRRRYLNASATLDRLLTLGVVPVINENDSVATEEIRFGDNDRLAARVAQAAGAKRLILLSDVDGLYTGDPGRTPMSERIARVERIDARITAMATRGTGSGMGSGGMASKIEAARIAGRAGIEVIVASGREMNALGRLDDGKNGTIFVPWAIDRGRKAWLGGRLTARGTVFADEGAVKALNSGASLLAAGVSGASGNFTRGDVVEIAGGEGTRIARGLAEYAAAEVVRIAGLKSSAIEAVLGYAPRAAVVHRDHMVVL